MQQRLISVAGLLQRGVRLDVILEAIIDEVVNALQADRGTLYLYDPQLDELFSKVAHLPELDKIRLRLGQGAAGIVAQTRKTISLPKAYKDQRFEPEIDIITGYRTKSLLACPVLGQSGDLIGVLQVLNKKEGPFSESDFDLLQNLSAQAGQVIEHTSLYGQLRQEAPGHRQRRRRLDYRFNAIVGVSDAMRDVYDKIEKASTTDANVLLQGESGTGKGLMAKAIHTNSSLRHAPFVVLDCATLPPSLIENELFGHEQGAYTGAQSKKEGKLMAADGGTLFIDEIGELSLAIQSRLLRVIQDRTFTRLGGTTPVSSHFRLITATNRDLQDMVDKGEFRSDLYYRIHVIGIHLPCLKQRGVEDIRGLALHFLDQFRKKHRRPDTELSKRALSVLQEHSWPGNIRELENCIESAVVMCDDRLIDVTHLSLPRGRNNPEEVQDLASTDAHRSLATIECEYVQRVLNACRGNQSEAARQLGISRNKLSRILKSF
jgi:transcriptional regulator with PAS, ATPase and Fis domain